MRRKGQYKIVTVVNSIEAPCQYNNRLVKYELLSCGHYHPEPEIRERAKAIRALFVAISGESQKRRCYQCVSGRPVVPEISRQWVADRAPAESETTK